MKKLFLVAVSIWLASCATAQQDPVLLRLVHYSDDKIIDEIRITGNAVDPNQFSVDNRFAIERNGKKIEAFTKLAPSILKNRRSYAYDGQSGGIVKSTPQILCRLGGAASGWVLEALYVSYDNNKARALGLRPVYSEAENCLFNKSIYPTNIASRISAAQTLAELRLLLRIEQ